MIEWSLDAFRACTGVDAIVIAAPPGHEHDFGGGAGADGATIEVVEGGATRAQSVANALEIVDSELVAIHDAARPLLTPALVEALVTRLAADVGAAGVIAAAPVTDTLKLASAETSAAFAVEETVNAVLVERTVDRSRLWAAQTPQVFRTQALRRALEVDAESRDSATDEAMLVEAAAGRVLIHPAPDENFKVTTPHDLRIAEVLLSERARA